MNHFILNFAILKLRKLNFEISATWIFLQIPYFLNVLRNSALKHFVPFFSNAPHNATPGNIALSLNSSMQHSLKNYGNFLLNASMLLNDIVFEPMSKQSKISQI